MARNYKTSPTVLSIAGSDSGGGAGIQADLKTFAALQVHGTTAITCLTAQNPHRVAALEPCSPKMLKLQIAAVFEAFEPRAIKTGMLVNQAIVKTVVLTLKRFKGRIPLVVDPVMISTSGKRLLEATAIKILKEQLLPLAALVTPNLSELETLVGYPVRSFAAFRKAARQLSLECRCAVLAKGGHLPTGAEAIDVLVLEGKEFVLRQKRVHGVRTHGTGCVLSAAIASNLAKGATLPQAVKHAKKFVAQAILSGGLSQPTTRVHSLT